MKSEVEVRFWVKVDKDSNGDVLEASIKKYLEEAPQHFLDVQVTVFEGEEDEEDDEEDDEDDDEVLEP